MKPNRMTCICNDATQTKTLNCFNCTETWSEPKQYFERVSECPLHHSSIAICSAGLPPLCERCSSTHKVSKVWSNDVFQGFEVVSKADQKPCICNDATQTKTLTCFNCKDQWSEPKQYFERVSECPLHHSSIAICCPGLPPLCERCSSTHTVAGDVFQGFEVLSK